jgi:hypothetical protein
LPDISESFEVESVPFFILLRVCKLLPALQPGLASSQGHTLLEQIQGAQASALSAAVEKQVNKKTGMLRGHQTH